MVLFILLFYLSKCSFLELFAIIELTGLLGDEIILGKQKKCYFISPRCWEYWEPSNPWKFCDNSWLEIMFWKNSNTLTVSGLTERDDKIKPKMDT